MKPRRCSTPGIRSQDQDTGTSQQTQWTHMRLRGNVMSAMVQANQRCPVISGWVEKLLLDRLMEIDTLVNWRPRSHKVLWNNMIPIIDPNQSDKRQKSLLTQEKRKLLLMTLRLNLEVTPPLCNLSLCPLLPSKMLSYKLDDCSKLGHICCVLVCLWKQQPFISILSAAWELPVVKLHTGNTAVVYLF